MKVGDLVAVNDAFGNRHIGVIVNFDEDGDPLVYRDGIISGIAYYRNDVEVISQC